MSSADHTTKKCIDTFVILGPLAGGAITFSRVCSGTLVFLACGSRSGRICSPTRCSWAAAPPLLLVDRVGRMLAVYLSKLIIIVMIQLTCFGWKDRCFYTAFSFQSIIRKPIICTVKRTYVTMQQHQWPAAVWKISWAKCLHSRRQQFCVSEACLEWSVVSWTKRWIEWVLALTQSVLIPMEPQPCQW